jgi:hypothetical protein
MRTSTFTFASACAFACALAIAGSLACSHHRAAPDDTLPADLHGGDETVAAPKETELARRQNAACETLAPRLTDCAIADARNTMSPAELAKLEIEKTAPIHTQKFLESCKAQSLSSRQVRVYEVCLKAETECTPLAECLDNANPNPR